MVKFELCFEMGFLKPLSVAVFHVSCYFFLKVCNCVKMLIPYILLCVVLCSGCFERYHRAIRQSFCPIHLSYSGRNWVEYSRLFAFLPQYHLQYLQLFYLMRWHTSSTTGPPFPAPHSSRPGPWPSSDKQADRSVAGGDSRNAFWWGEAAAFSFQMQQVMGVEWERLIAGIAGLAESPKVSASMGGGYDVWIWAFSWLRRLYD